MTGESGVVRRVHAASVLLVALVALGASLVSPAAAATDAADPCRVACRAQKDDCRTAAETAFEAARAACTGTRDAKRACRKIARNARNASYDVCAARFSSCRTCCMAAGTGCAECSNGVRDGNETDVDCGGGTCASCENGVACTSGSDCSSGFCSGGVCVEACSVQPAGTSCADDGNPCTTDTCANGACAHVAGNAGASCRAATEACDAPEVCDGASADCPVDARKAADTPCGNGGLCDGQSATCCEATCAPDECGFLPDGCGGQKDCGACEGCPLPTGRRCATGLTPGASNVCRGAAQSRCSRGNECQSGLCECINPSTDAGCDTSGLAVTATWPGSGCLHDLGDGTVGDSCKGAQWEKKTGDAGPHDVNAVYTWAGCCDASCTQLCQPDAAAAATCLAQADGGTEGCDVCASGTCNVDPKNFGATTTVWDWLNQLNDASFAGHDDWRLPAELRRAELETILVTPCTSSPCVAPLLGATAGGPYWAGDTRPEPCLGKDSESAFAVDFSIGLQYPIPKTSGISVRAVRSVGVCRGDGTSCQADADCTGSDRCDDRGGFCRSDLDQSCSGDGDCPYYMKCENGSCAANYPIGWPCTGNLAYTPGTTEVCRRDTNQCSGLIGCFQNLGGTPHASSECESGWCMKSGIIDPGRLKEGENVCCRELDEECTDDYECCAGTDCTDPSDTPRRVRRCIDDGTGTKRCQKLRLIGDTCNADAECLARPADVQCGKICLSGNVGQPCGTDSDCKVGMTSGVCSVDQQCFSPSTPPATSPEQYKRREGETCWDDVAEGFLECDAGLVCTDCTGFDRVTGERDPAWFAGRTPPQGGTGYRCLSPDVGVGCCSMYGRDVLHECGDDVDWCCNGRCTDTQTDPNNCGLCNVDCDVLGPHLKGGDVCWRTDGTCHDGQCGISKVCAPGQVCSVANTGFGDAPVCSTPVSVTPTLFALAQQQGSFSGLIVQANTHLACDSPEECLSTQICFKDCAFELKATTGGSWGGIRLTPSVGGFAQPGQGAACTDPGVCMP